MRRKRRAYCAERRVFELQHIDPAACRSGDGSATPDRDSANSRTACGSIEPAPFGSAARPHQELGGRAERHAAPRCPLRCVGQVEQRDHVDFGQPRQLAQRLVHEDAAAVRPADRSDTARRTARAGVRGSARWLRSGRGSSRPAAAGTLRCRSTCGQAARAPARAHAPAAAAGRPARCRRDWRAAGRRRRAR